MGNLLEILTSRTKQKSNSEHQPQASRSQGLSRLGGALTVRKGIIIIESPGGNKGGKGGGGRSKTKSGKKGLCEVLDGFGGFFRSRARGRRFLVVWSRRGGGGIKFKRGEQGVEFEGGDSDAPQVKRLLNELDAAVSKSGCKTSNRPVAAVRETFETKKDEWKSLFLSDYRGPISQEKT